ncbi:MAG: 50S ribosomal protein L18 [Desulfuromonadaceae bacterium]|nr:50S ribosomal protein L18 [Desulfuromonadaceae bacterium]
MSVQKNNRNVARARRQERVRKKVRGTQERPRLSVFRSAKHIYAQLIDDGKGETMVTASTLHADSVGLADLYSGNVEAAKRVGIAIARMALARNIDSVVFDRNGFLYHGRVKALADGAREGGLKF